jgi:hypothetical protein
MVWDANRQKIYLSVSSTATSNPNTVSVLDPSSGQIVATYNVGSEPDALALSGDGQYLFVGLDGSGSVVRLKLPNFIPDLTISLGSHPSFGPYQAIAMAVAPGNPHILAVSQGTVAMSPTTTGSVVIFDDAVARPNVTPRGSYFAGTLAWKRDLTTLWGGNNQDSMWDLYVLGVTNSGVSLSQQHQHVFSEFRFTLRYNSGNNLLYSDDGKIIDPATGQVVGNFSLPATGQTFMALDAANSLAFFMAPTKINASDWNLMSYAMGTHAATSTYTVAGVSGIPRKLVRWGIDGLAFKTDLTTNYTGVIYLYSGPLVAQ